MTIDEAIAVLNGAQHRGARNWYFHGRCRRVLPEGWNGLDEAAPPTYTPWEAMTLARRLVEIGGLQPAKAARPLAAVPGHSWCASQRRSR
jgi:hypothetical protein